MGKLLLSVALLLNGCVYAATLDKFVVVRSGAESDAMRLAMQDLERDLYTVTGLAPVFLAYPPAANSLPSDTVVVYFGTVSAAPWLASLAPPSCLQGWEVHCVVSVPSSSPSTNGYASLVATGSGLRGGIFGAYTFSDAVLGFKPMYLFTDTPAPYAGRGGVVYNDSLSIVIGEPQFEYRAMFVNDEDLSAVHRADPLGRNVMDLATWDAFYQTALRNKANMMLIGTNPFPDDTATALASRRGMVVSGHHYNLLGSNVFSWPFGGQDWNWENDAGTMSYLWRASIAAQTDFPEVVWSIGLRGLNDGSYPGCDDPSQEQVCGETISAVMANQTEWIHSYPGQANATIVVFLWQELLNLLAKGYLVIPEGSDIIFTDTGTGYVQTDPTWSEYAAGVYYHTAAWAGVGDTNQVDEMVPVSRIAQQLMNVVTYANRTKVFVLNLSDLKPCVMGSAAAFNLMWDPTPWNTTTDYNATARAWYAKFALDYAGLANPVDQATYAGLWESFFSIPYIFAGNSDGLLANNVAPSATKIANDWAAGKGVSSQTEQAVQQSIYSLGADSALPILVSLNATAWTLLESVPNRYRGYFVSHLLLQITNQLTSLQALEELLAAAKALQPVTPGGPAPDPSTGLTHVSNALAALDVMLGMRRVTEGDAGAWSGNGMSPLSAMGPIVNIPAAFPLRGYFLGDTLVDMQWPRGAVFTLQQSLLAPLHTPLFPVRGSVWYQFEAYQQEVASNYPYVAFNPQWNFPTYVRINCPASFVGAGACANGPDGGWFSKSGAATLTLQVMSSSTGEEPHTTTWKAMTELARLGLAPRASSTSTRDAISGLVIHYTSDGTVPTPSSPVYTPGQAPTLASLLPNGQASVTVIAMAWVGGVPTGQLTTTNWRSV